MTELLAANWIWIAAIGLFVVMHRSGHGCGMHGHGGHDHGQHQHHGPASRDRRLEDRSST